MAPTEDGQEIVQVRVVRDAPTGEGERYQTSDGRWWKPVFSMPVVTGRTYGWKINNQIRPKQH